MTQLELELDIDLDELEKLADDSDDAWCHLFFGGSLCGYGKPTNCDRAYDGDTVCPGCHKLVCPDCTYVAKTKFEKKGNSWVPREVIG